MVPKGVRTHPLQVVLAEPEVPSSETHLPAQDVRDSHLVVVDYVGEMVRGQAVRFSEDKVFDWERFVVDGVVDQVLLCKRARRALQQEQRSSIHA